jgi:hypothetical protein
VIELGAHRTQTSFNIPKALAISELGETHRKELIPTRETLLLMVAAIARYALLELVAGKVLHELRKDRLANVHPSLSAFDAAGSGPAFGRHLDRKKFKSKNLKNPVNRRMLRMLAGIQNSCPGQQ